MGRIKIKDLDVDLEELKKKDPEILRKIRGGYYGTPPRSATMQGADGGPAGITKPRSRPDAGPDTMFCCTGKDSGCQPGADTMFCCTGDDSGCHPFFE